jgi:hypothetical protein
LVVEGTAAKLKMLLTDVANHVDASFSGLGLIVWDGTTPLPIHSMRPAVRESLRRTSACELLTSVAQDGGAYHDGFHVLNRSMEVSQLSVYFSPAIIPDLVLPAHAEIYGGRYLAAAFGSCSPGVLCTGVLSRRYGPYVFERGKEI